MSTVAEMLSGDTAFMPECGTVARLRPREKPDPYNPDRTNADWSDPERVEIPGFIASGSSTEVTDGARQEVTSTATLTLPDRAADVKVGDRIEPVPADGRLWRVTGFPARDRSPFTKWGPTTECTLEEVLG